MSPVKSTLLCSIKGSPVTEEQVASVIINSNLCSYQIGLRFGISPVSVSEIGHRYMGVEEYDQKESTLVNELKKNIAHKLLCGCTKSSILKDLAISNHAFEQLSSEFLGADGFDYSQITAVVDDEDSRDASYDDLDNSKCLKNVSLKYLDFEVNYTTESNPEESIIALCKLLMGGGNAT